MMRRHSMLATVLVFTLALLGIWLSAPLAERPHPAPPIVAAAAPVPAPEVMTPDGTFVVKPYLQLGDVPALASRERVEVMWQTSDVDAGWSVEARPITTEQWTRAGSPAMRRVAVPEIEPHRLYRATVTGLEPGRRYLVLEGQPKAEEVVWPGLSPRGASAASRLGRR